MSWNGSEQLERAMEEVLEDELRTEERRTEKPVEPGENTQDTGMSTEPNPQKRPRSLAVSDTPNGMLWLLKAFWRRIGWSGDVDTIKWFLYLQTFSDQGPLTYKARKGLSVLCSLNLYCTGSIWAYMLVLFLLLLVPVVFESVDWLKLWVLAPCVWCPFLELPVKSWTMCGDSKCSDSKI